MKAHAPLSVRILTHNIRYATSSPFKGEVPWSEREHLMINELKFHALHNPESFICLQEVLHTQLLDILAGLNTSTSSTATPAGREEWRHIGVGRDDGHQQGEYSPILYRPAVWHVEDCKTVWLSPTPDRPGKGWDAGSVRIVTVGNFVHRGSKQRVTGLCTHFDEQGVVSRRESAKMIERIVADVTATPAGGDACGGEGGTACTSVWLAGDLNSEPSEEAYQILNGEDSLLRDSRGLAKWRYGNRVTCTGFQEEMSQVIDYVFVGKKGWVVQGHSVLANRFDDGVYNSDHRAVVVDALLES
ncbi:hypothetical protein SVAN01_01997 [Stagonosporopsis vannaccii]|nr:hypothetical protein SVAN01_01997 [Stagonosporopsis vannaccii]